ncbi:MAG: hypothetical protein GY853_13175 [PVC group bacterium]|nr:hypothetical protein [PVC group bacterium]
MEHPFIIFVGDRYYARPGWCGYLDSAKTLADAIVIAKKDVELEDTMYRWWQVVDIRTRRIVAGEGSSHTGLYGECDTKWNKDS